MSSHANACVVPTVSMERVDTLPGYGYIVAMLDGHDKEKLQKRLARIAGQVNGIQRMVADDRYCIDIVMQVSAVRSALAKVSEIVLERHFETCMVDAFESGDTRERQQKVDELMKVFSRHGNS